MLFKRGNRPFKIPIILRNRHLLNREREGELRCYSNWKSWVTKTRDLNFEKLDIQLSRTFYGKLEQISAFLLKSKESTGCLRRKPLV